MFLLSHPAIPTPHHLSLYFDVLPLWSCLTHHMTFQVYFTWVIRDFGSAEWFHSLLQAIEEQDTQNRIEINIYLTAKIKEDDMNNIIVRTLPFPLPSKYSVLERHRIALRYVILEFSPVPFTLLSLSRHPPFAFLPSPTFWTMMVLLFDLTLIMNE